eukprot:3316454-Pleurochrysis_carterae.AAC.1
MTLSGYKCIRETFTCMRGQRQMWWRALLGGRRAGASHVRRGRGSHETKLELRHSCVGGA